jgi:hypothetical protein
MQVRWGEECNLLLILELGTRRGGEWSASRPGHTLPLESTPGTHWVGGSVGLRAGLDTEDGGKIPCLCRGSNSGRPK